MPIVKCFKAKRNLVSAKEFATVEKNTFWARLKKENRKGVLTFSKTIHVRKSSFAPGIMYVAPLVYKHIGGRTCQVKVEESDRIFDPIVGATYRLDYDEEYRKSILKWVAGLSILTTWFVESLLVFLLPHRPDIALLGSFPILAISLIMLILK